MFDLKYLPNAVHVKQDLYIKLIVGVLAVYVVMVVAGYKGIIGELVFKVVLAGNHEGDVVVEVDARVDVEAEVEELLLDRG